MFHIAQLTYLSLTHQYVSYSTINIFVTHSSICFIPGVAEPPVVPAVEAPDSEVIGSLAVTAMIITVAVVVLFDIITLILGMSNYINAGIAKP